MLCSMIAPARSAKPCGRMSAIQTSRLRPPASASTCFDPLWCFTCPPTAAHTKRRAASSTSTISSRSTRPLANVTIPGVVFEPRIDNDAGGEEPVHGAYVADRLPCVLGAGVDHDLLADRCHGMPPQLCPPQ